MIHPKLFITGFVTLFCKITVGGKNTVFAAIFLFKIMLENKLLTGFRAVILCLLLTFVQINSMTSTSRYEEWLDSPFYHQLYAQRNEQSVVFVLHLINFLNLSKESRILEIGCGRGEHSIALSANDFDLHAIDSSPASIAYASQFEKDNLHFYLHDIRLPFLSNYFDCAFNIDTRFGYFRTKREHESAIRTIATSLKPDGIFVMDYSNSAYKEKHLLATETKNEGDTVFTLQCWEDETDFYKKITVTAPALPAPLEFLEKNTKLSLPDFTTLFNRHGLEVEAVFGDHQLGVYDADNSPRLIIKARKGVPHPADKEKRIYSDGRSTDALT